MADTSFFLNGCMKWQHAVILESIWETDSIITHFPASRTGLLTPLLTCLTLLSLSPLLGQIIYSPTRFLNFALWTKPFYVQISLLSSLRTKIFLSPTPILQKDYTTIPNSVLAANSFHSSRVVSRSVGGGGVEDPMY